MILINKYQSVKKEDLIDVIMDLTIKLQDIDTKYSGNIKRIFDFYNVEYTQRKHR